VKHIPEMERKIKFHKDEEQKYKTLSEKHNSLSKLQASKSGYSNPLSRARSKLALEAATATPCGCLMAMVPKASVLKFTEYANKAIAADTAVEIETEPHVTCLYGFKENFDPARLQAWFDEPLEFTIGKLSRFECPEYDVIKFDVTSPDLVKLNRSLSKDFASDITASEYAYHPHLTVAYVVKGTNKSLDGKSVTGLTGQKFKLSTLLYSLPEKADRREITVGNKL
jgi:hypothetical protein